MMKRDNTGEIQTTNAHPMEKKHTILLPYHTPCSSCESIIIQLELDCLETIHMRCLQAKLIKIESLDYFFSCIYSVMEQHYLIDSWTN